MTKNDFYSQYICCYNTFISYGSSARNSLPVPVPPAIVAADRACPVDEVRSLKRDEIHNLLNTTVNAILLERYGPPCHCGLAGEWTRMAYLDMTDPNQQCPPNWRFFIGPLRACARSSTGRSCDSSVFPSHNRTYSQVCGRMIGYQSGSNTAFNEAIQFNRNLEGPYIDGVSLTHGRAGSRQHIWSFVSAQGERFDHLRSNCPCTTINFDWPYTVPSFVGSDYFCETGNRGPGYSRTVNFLDDPLWNGEGCGVNTNCCQFNNPPWFCTVLPQPTSDDLEVRICGGRDKGETDVFVSLIDIYTQ